MGRRVTVQPGDTLWSIARRHGTTWRRLWVRNRAAILAEQQRRYRRWANPYRRRPWDGIFPGTVLEVGT